MSDDDDMVKLDAGGDWHPVLLGAVELWWDRLPERKRKQLGERVETSRRQEAARKRFEQQWWEGRAERKRQTELRVAARKAREADGD